MSKIYLKRTGKLENLKTIELVERQIEEGTESIVEFNGVQYEVIPEDEIDSKDDVFGYIEISNKDNKKAKVKLEDVRASVNQEVAVQKKMKNGKLLGYIEAKDTEGNEIYIGLFTKRFNILPWLIGAIIIILALILWNKYEPEDGRPDNEITQSESEDGKDKEFKDGDKGEGELTSDAPDFEEQQMFRMKLNCTPTIADGVMNIRIESPQEENKSFAFTVKVYALQKVDKEGKVVENFNNNLIYESPLIYANENIENCELDRELADGTYVGRAVYDVYDLELNYIGQTAARLELVVKNTKPVEVIKETPAPTEQVVSEEPTEEAEEITVEEKEESKTKKNDIMAKFVEAVKTIAIISSVALGVAGGVIGLMLLLLAIFKKIKVFNDTNTDEYKEENFEIVYQTSITTEGNRLAELFRKSDRVWTVVIPNHIINDRKNDTFKIELNKYFCKRYNGEQLIIRLGENKNSEQQGFIIDEQENEIKLTVQK